MARGCVRRLYFEVRINEFILFADKYGAYVLMVAVYSNTFHIVYLILCVILCTQIFISKSFSPKRLKFRLKDMKVKF